MSLVRGTLILSVAALISKFLGSVFRVPLQNIAGDDVLGIFSLVYPVYMVILTMAVAGIPLAISQLISQVRTEGNQEQINVIYKTASILGVLFGIGSFLFIWALSDPIAFLLGGPETELALIVVSSALVVVPYMAVYRGFFQGFQLMTPTAVSQVIEQFVRVAIILIAAFWLVREGVSNQGVAAGVMSGSSVGALGSFIYLRVLFKRYELLNGRRVSLSRDRFWYWTKMILSRSIPIAIGTVTLAAVNVVDSVTVPYGLKAYGLDSVYETYGLYGRGQALIQIATVAATSVVLPLVPRMTELLTAGRSEDLRGLMAKAYQLMHLVTWPVMVGLVVLTVPINVALFTNAEGSTVILLLNVSTAVTSFAVLTVGMLQGLQRAGIAAWIVFVSLLVKALLNIVLVSAYGLIGAAIATIIVFSLILGWNYWTIRIRFDGPKFWTSDHLKVLSAAIVMGGVIFVGSLFVSTDEWTRLSALIYTMVMTIVGVAVFAGGSWALGVLPRGQLFRRK